MSELRRRNTTRIGARVALCMVLLLGAMLTLPRPASRFVAPDASAQIPTPTLPPILEQSPSPSPKPTSSPKPKPGRRPGSDDEGSGKRKRETQGPAGEAGEGKGKTGAKKKRKKIKAPGFVSGLRIPGAYDTGRLVAAAAQLRAVGFGAEKAMARVFPPFIIAGEAAWIDTWGAPRFGPGPLVRRHQGQDVFCDLGAPVLASEAGRIEFGEGGLGGRVARLHRADRSYWYYAHLSDWNDELRSGDRVRRGDVIGYCGNTGNAVTTPPHVHFGWYQPNGVAKNPMKKLIGWLRDAERRAVRGAASEGLKRIRNIDPLTIARRFGDAFAPDRSELGLATESLWASGGSPATGALSLAQAALQAALAETGFEIASIGSLDLHSEGAGTEEAATTLDPGSALAQLLQDHRRGPTEAAD